MYFKEKKLSLENLEKDYLKIVFKKLNFRKPFKSCILKMKF